MKTKLEKIQTIARNKLLLYNNQLGKIASCKKVKCDFLLTDYSQLIAFYTLVKNKQFLKAYRVMNEMDTFIRESVSTTIYDFLRTQ